MTLILTNNDISRENALQGTPREYWDLPSGSSSLIEGFTTDISVNRGETVEFKVNSDAPYKIEIFRLGYYNGDGARLVSTIDGLQASVQPDPLRDPESGLVDAGNWSVAAHWTTPKDLTSGVFLAKLTRLDGTGESHIPFIVRDDDSRSDILFQTSDTTWQAYNPWGSIDADGRGASLYSGDAPPDRAYAVSYNRPITTRDDINLGDGGSPWNYILGPEYSAIYWLEKNGYDVTYSSGQDTHSRGSNLLNHTVFLTAGHDEYWSGPQRAAVETARDAGVNLMFWTGNDAYWRVRWGESIDDTHSNNRTIWCYKESFAADSIDPSSEWTGLFRDGRFASGSIGAGVPENALTGQMFGSGWETSSTPATILVSSDYSLFRFWDNTSVSSLTAGQMAELGDRLLTYEFNYVPDNEWRPDGIIRLSSTTVFHTTPEVQSGTLPTGTIEPITHSLTLYRAPSGALVFSAGTVFWSWGLSGDLDVGTNATPSPDVQQAMVNVFADMGVQPTTLSASLAHATASSDVFAPTSTIEIDTAGLIYGLGVPITISGLSVDIGGQVAATEISINGTKWHPASGTDQWSFSFIPDLPGEYQIRSRAVDDSVNIGSASSSAIVRVEHGPVAEIIGTAGDNKITGSNGQDWMYGLEGNDTIFGSWWNDFAFGGSGSDVIMGEHNADTLWGELGDDWLDGGEGGDFIHGGPGADVIAGGLGSDSLWGGEDGDRIYGGDGIDEIVGGSGADALLGEGEQDWIWGREGVDEIVGGSGNDWLSGEDDQDWIYGQYGYDSIEGGSGNDFLYGGSGDDQIAGGIGNDYIDGGDGQDWIYGEGGDDVIESGRGNDFLWGGDGTDRFVFGSVRDISNGNGNYDTIMDFVPGEDILDLRGVSADVMAAGGSSFQWGGNNPAPFSLWTTHVPEGIFVSGDISGDAAPDFQLLLRGANTLGSGNVWLDWPFA